MSCKELTINDTQYQVRHMLPIDGSFIYMRMMGALARAAEERAADQREEPTTADDALKNTTPEQRARAFCTLALMRGLSYEDTQRVHRTALSVVFRAIVGGEFVPVMASDGRIAFDDMLADPALTQELVMESLVFNLSPYFSARKPA